METKKYTIEDLREGKVAVVNDGTVEELRNVLKKAFPKDTFEALASHKYYYKKNNNGEEWWSHNDNKLRLPTQSVKVFLKEIAIEEVKEKAKKGVNIVMETKELKVGDYIRGFKYDCSEYLEELMNNHIGQIAIIVEKHKNLIIVKFEDNSTWYYPHDLAIEHLFEPLKNTPFHKPDFSHLLDVDKVLEKGIKNSGLNEIPIEELEEHFKDNINPSHYKRLPKETIERIQDNLTPEEFKGYLKGNILKYLDRYENKNGVEDLKKANWYLNKLIEIENGK